MKGNSVRLVLTVAAIFGCLVIGAIAFDFWYIADHNLTTVEATQIISASIAAVTVAAGSVSAVAGAVSASRSAKVSKDAEAALERATEALSRAMLPSGIDTGLRVEPFAPRIAMFSVDSMQDSWRVVRVVRRGIDGEHSIEDVDDAAIGARGWRIPDSVKTNEDFDRWCVLIDLTITDVRQVATWILHGRPIGATRPEDPLSALGTVHASNIYWEVQDRVVRIR